MAEQVWSRGSIIEGGVPGVLAALSVPTDQTCALCMRRPDYFASLNYVEHRADEPYCSDCLDELIEQSGPIIERLIPLSGDNGDGTAISREQFAAILRGEPVIAGKRRRLLTLADGPFTIVERHYGPGPHPGTGTSQEAHSGRESPGFDPEDIERASPMPGECFECSARWLTTGQGREFPSARLVHGIVAGQGFIAGKRFAHAWIEIDDWVYDRAQDIVMPRDAYYRIGKISDTVSYDRDEAMIEMVRSEHWGPWTDHHLNFEETQGE